MVESSNEFQKEQEVALVKLNFVNWLPEYQPGSFRFTEAHNTNVRVLVTVIIILNIWCLAKVRTADKQ